VSWYHLYPVAPSGDFRKVDRFDVLAFWAKSSAQLPVSYFMSIAQIVIHRRCKSAV